MYISYYWSILIEELEHEDYSCSRLGLFLGLIRGTLSAAPVVNIWHCMSMSCGVCSSKRDVWRHAFAGQKRPRPLT
jgi:hypothetical protein